MIETLKILWERTTAGEQECEVDQDQKLRHSFRQLVRLVRNDVHQDEEHPPLGYEPDEEQRGETDVLGHWTAVGEAAMQSSIINH